MVDFCPECESMLRKNRGSDGKVYWMCGCGYQKEADNSDSKRKIMPHQRKNMIKKTLIIEEPESVGNPTTNVTCPECDHNTAEYFQYQTRSADEPATTFYKCLKCKHKWREY